jgi:hypothetical protein
MVKRWDVELSRWPHPFSGWTINLRFDPARLNFVPIHQWTKNIGYIVDRVELEPFGSNIDQTEAAGIPGSDQIIS